MAKKSAKSKGFRKQTAKKPYLSKKDIGILCVIVAVLAVGAFFLFRYDDGALKVQDGAVVTEGDNWLIVDGSNVRGRARYFKLGEIGEIDGYSREKSSVLTDANLPQYVFTSDAEEAAASISVTASHSSGEALARYSMATLESLGGSELSELKALETAGRTVQYYVRDVAPAEAEADGEAAEETAEEAGEAQDAEEAEEAEAPQFTRTVIGYFDAAHDSCIVVQAESSAASADECLSEEALTAALEEAVAAVTLEEAK